jgi:hypothetical protein
LLKNKTLILGCLIVIILAFSYGLVRLFLLRFEAGDVYAPYSSLRSDPLGTRALYESLVHLNLSPVTRNYRRLHQVQFNEFTTFLYLGTAVFDPTQAPEEFAEAVDRLTAAGGRLVLTFLPVGSTGRQCFACGDAEAKNSDAKAETDPIADERSDNEQSSKPPGDGSDKKKPESSESEAEQPQKSDAASALFKTVSLEEIWGLRFKYDAAKKKPTMALVNADAEADELPDSISWHTILHFDDLQAPWKIIYNHNGQPVIVERPFNRGSILLCTDSYIFSNEALRAERHPDLLIRLIGPNSHIVFDEAHLGVFKIPGLAGLIRNLGLHWFFLVIALLFILFVWKNSVYFVPPLDNGSDELNANSNAGRDYAQGLISLLRRNIPVKSVLRVGLEEWKNSYGPGKMQYSGTFEELTHVAEMEESLSENQTKPVKGYNTIRNILSKRN